MQLSFDLTIHKSENNPISQAHLEHNRELFSDSCFEVLKALINGAILTTDNAKELAGTRSLPRRIKDLRDNLGIPITDEWVLIEGRKSHLKWHMTESDKIEALRIIMSKLKRVA